MAPHCNKTAQSGVGQWMQSRPKRVAAKSSSQKLSQLLTIENSPSTQNISMEKPGTLRLECTLKSVNHGFKSWLEAKNGVL
jgi:outer membrane PBP1 activator LpoA protein